MYQTTTTNNKILMVAQSGGPTPVVNASLAGIISAAKKAGVNVLGLKHGFEAILKHNLQDAIVNLSALTDEELATLRQTPGAFLGGSRYQFSSNKDYESVLDFFESHGCDYFIVIGGNGTMGTCMTLLNTARNLANNTSSQEYALYLKKLCINGSPKTVDNDIVEIEYAPGYLSAARYVALAVKSQAADLSSMRTFEQVRIIETMGRAVGWLVAAAGLARQHEDDAPQLIYPPEYPLDLDEFIADIERIYKRDGYVIAVVGEGMKDKDNNPVGSEQFGDKIEGNVRPIIVGAAEYLARQVSTKLGLVARGQNLGMCQRSFSEVRSAFDEQEAFESGVAVANASFIGKNGKMIWNKGCVSLEEVAYKEKVLLREFYDQQQKFPTEKFINWLAPLVGKLPNYLQCSTQRENL